MSASAPVVHWYQQALERFRWEGSESPLVERMSELISLLNITATLASGASGRESLSTVLRIVVQEMQAERAVLFVKRDDGRFDIRSSWELPTGVPSAVGFESVPDDVTIPGEQEEIRAYGLTLLCPIHRRGVPIALLGLGPRAAGSMYGAQEHAFLRCVAACTAAAIESDLIYEELRRKNEKLAVKVYQLHNLFDATRELTGSFEEGAIQSLIMTSVMGHFVVSRCALFLLRAEGLTLVHERGLRRSARNNHPIPLEQAQTALDDLIVPKAVGELAHGPLRRRLEDARLSLAVPLTMGERVEGVLAIGERASGTPFSQEDREFAQSLARQALVALESARLHQIRMEKERQDHDLQLAREIQRGLFPPHLPEVPGFDIAAESRSCYEVGGDCYDWIQLRDGRFALVIADVSGKGTPASLLMASVHAFIEALAGTDSPSQVIDRLNRFLFARTQANTYVTLFYGELDAQARSLAYVNAGHVPPYRLSRKGTVSRLCRGGLALGILDGVRYEQGQVKLEPGDILAAVTDGVTEAGTLDDCEFGDERVCEALRTFSGESASAILDRLIAAVRQWSGSEAFRDDLTALILKAL